MSRDTILDREFLPLRAKIIEIAAALDRLQRSNPIVEEDPRMNRVRNGLEAVLHAKDDRAEQVQLIFSLPYDDAWMNDFGIHGGGE